MESSRCLISSVESAMAAQTNPSSNLLHGLRNSTSFFDEINTLQPTVAAQPLPKPVSSWSPQSYEQIMSKRGAAQTVPKSDIQDALKKKSRLGAFVAEQILLNPDFTDDLGQICQKYADEITTSESPMRQSERERINNNWYFMLSILAPHLDENRFWHVDVVEHFALHFLTFLVKCTPPLPGRKTIKSRTLVGWLSLFIHAIVKYCRDPSTGRAVGMSLLTQGKLYQDLKNQAAKLTHDFKLDRHYDRRMYYGRYEVYLMICAALKAEIGRGPILQNIIMILLPFCIRI
ncbi:hypothetical protein H0H93_004178 [Arthromyces matolae]|nr:hypothetical protein H0H93_004178 [Arthromyces matolae]